MAPSRGLRPDELLNRNGETSARLRKEGRPGGVGPPSLVTRLDFVPQERRAAKGQCGARCAAVGTWACVVRLDGREDSEDRDVRKWCRVTALFVDEGKRRGYLIVAAIIADSDITDLRREVKKLRTPGTERIHFVHESDGRRRALLKAFVRLGVHTTVLVTDGLDDRIAREWSLGRVADLAAETRRSRIVIEMDDSIVRTDNRTLYRAVGIHGLRDRIRYEHKRSAAEPLLWLPDAVAWSFGRGGDIRDLVEPLIERVVRHDA